MKETSYQALHDHLKPTIRPENLILDETRTAALGTDAGIYRIFPRMVVGIETEDELCQVLAACTEHGLPLTFRAAGTSVSGQSVSDSVLVMLKDGWDRFDVGEDGKQVTTGVGLTGGRVNELLLPLGRQIGPDPASLQSARMAGIVANNSSGMSCGVRCNTQNTLRGMRLILADGTLLDTRDPQSRNRFITTHGDLIQKIRNLAQRANAPGIKERIQKKFSIKNTCGYSVNALVDHDDPVEIIAHLMVGSEGTLGFVSEVTLDTVALLPRRATSLMAFNDMDAAVVALGRIRDTGVHAAELMDRNTLAALEELPELPDFLRGLGPDAAALLVEVRGKDKAHLDERVDRVVAALDGCATVTPLAFTHDEKECQRLWEIRDGFDPIICAKARPGALMLSEDIAVPVEHLASVIRDLQALFTEHGYDNTVIFGHALAGNLHFILLPDFRNPREIVQYQAFMEDLVKIVVDRYDGSLKAEHGTGRSMAPFVAHEWGEEIYRLMVDIKDTFDPLHLLNPGVLINSDPNAHASHLKEIYPVDPLVDACIECGFCERFCVANGLTLSSRQRIALSREIARLEQTDQAGDRLQRLKKGFRYNVMDTCAADGLCGQACPSKINTGLFVKKLRQNQAGFIEKRLATAIGDHMDTVTAGGRAALGAAHLGRRLLGDSLLGTMAASARKLTGNRSPRWFSHMAKAQKWRPNDLSFPPKTLKQMVYFPSCINRTMGDDPKSKAGKSLMAVTESLCRKAGFTIRYPREMDALCCGLAFASKGMEDAAQKRSDTLAKALLEASDGGRLPILCDTSPCLLHMKETLPKSLQLLEPIEFTLKFLLPHLTLTQKQETVVVHPVCSAKKMGLEDQLEALAKLCCTKVVTTRTNCCGFAGDRGFTKPELNAHGLKNLKAQIPEGVTRGFSTSRTCEIGLAEEGDISFQSILYLVDEVSR